MDIAQAISCTHTTIHVLPEATPMIDPKKVSPTHHLNPVRQLGASHSFVAEIFAYDRSAAAILCSELEKQTKGIPVSIWKELRDGGTYEIQIRYRLPAQADDFTDLSGGAGFVDRIIASLYRAVRAVNHQAEERMSVPL
ncbi:TPA: hypothetical protein DDX46_03900 [Candidatus Saccharibacteria bacterium]|nr:MAG: hypothetical protein UW38_C0001G0602 [Candidatus Saccharibacteria bacterium GW2011_GWC2_44_17]MBH1956869.1 hypothetical protein [Candidatus Saccharibacteria bacterium]OGL33776.1 MAG: hypothetical protein A3E20_03420 [Candidatus Saccharibacteria bacterium RIFCSPHIGHO2_12_FULL_47_16]MBH1973343.1 hypothetical protein [Candidatus Saccharibacteria bacterium]MBH1990416.1 hypothetical protein [Candidatus Saccharibacteria bacterium]